MSTTVLCLVALILATVINGTDAQECRTADQGQHFTSLLPFYDFNKDAIITTRIKFDKNTAQYLFPPTESKGRLCSQSWNQLLGATRCGLFTSNHKDSDRFVWRRAGSCLQYDSLGHVTGEVQKCPGSKFIEWTASAYDNGRKPFEHIGALLKEFSTKLRINKTYKLTITFQQTQTIYQLSNTASRVLEIQTIDHRSCDQFHVGVMQGLYFGGQCPAPQAVSVCYI